MRLSRVAWSAGVALIIGILPFTACSKVSIATKSSGSSEAFGGSDPLRTAIVGILQSLGPVFPNAVSTVGAGVFQYVQTETDPIFQSLASLTNAQRQDLAAYTDQLVPPIRGIAASASDFVAAHFCFWVEGEPFTNARCHAITAAFFVTSLGPALMVTDMAEGLIYVDYKSVLPLVGPSPLRLAQLVIHELGHYLGAGSLAGASDIANVSGEEEAVIEDPKTLADGLNGFAFLNAWAAGLVGMTPGAVAKANGGTSAAPAAIPTAPPSLACSVVLSAPDPSAITLPVDAVGNPTAQSSQLTIGLHFTYPATLATVTATSGNFSWLSYTVNGAQDAVLVGTLTEPGVISLIFTVQDALNRQATCGPMGLNVTPVGPPTVPMYRMVSGIYILYSQFPTEGSPLFGDAGRDFTLYTTASGPCDVEVYRCERAYGPYFISTDPGCEGSMPFPYLQQRLYACPPWLSAAGHVPLYLADGVAGWARGSRIATTDSAYYFSAALDPSLWNKTGIYLTVPNQ